MEAERKKKPKSSHAALIRAGERSTALSTGPGYDMERAYSGTARRHVGLSSDVGTTAQAALNKFHLFGEKLSKASPGQVIRKIRTGFDATVLATATEHFEMPRSEFVKIIGISSATADRKIRDNAKLGVAESERLVRIALIENKASHIFGSAELAKQWLKRPNLVLGEAPLTLLDTDAGAGEVRKILSAIAYGGVA